jgi:D-glutamate cyclase
MTFTDTLLPDTLLTDITSRLDRVVNLDIGGRGVEHLYDSAIASTGSPLTAQAAQLLSQIKDGDTVVITTGSVSRSWISPTIGENDGPAGGAVLARAITLARKATVVLLAEESLLPQMHSMLTAAGVTVLPYEIAKQANDGGTLIAAAVRGFTTSDADAAAAAHTLLAELQPSLLISIERTGRNADGVYCSMRGVDYGMERARIDHLFDIALEQGLPTLCVGDGGNEIGMANVADAIVEHVPFGDHAATGGAGIGAVTGCSVLVTAACSNWGVYAIAAAWAALEKNQKLIHRPAQERFLLQRGVEIGLINSVVGVVDDRVDNIAPETHIAVTELLGAIVDRHI